MINLGSLIIDTLRKDFLIKSFLRIGHKKRLLDLGCGSRPYQSIYEHHVEESIGADVPFSPHGLGKVDVVLDGKRLPFEEGFFDIVLCSEVMEHVPDPVSFLGEVHRVLKPEGHLILTTPFLVPIHEEPNDYFRFTLYGLRHLLEKSGFQLLSLDSFSEMFGVLLSLCIQIELKFWSMLSKKCRIQSLYSAFNPLIFIFVILPQLFYLKILKVSARVPYIKRFFAKMSYTTKGYGVLSLRNGIRLPNDGD